jgi:hypothetical protein
MTLTNKKLTASLSLIFGVILAGGFLLAQAPVPFPSQPQNPVFAPPQPSQGGFQIPGRAVMTLLTAPASNSTGLITDPTGPCYAQNYAQLYLNPFTRDLVGCLPAVGLASGNSLSGQMNYAAIINGNGLPGGIAATALTGATVLPLAKASFFNGTTALVTITPWAGISDGAEVKLIFTGSGSGLTWTAAGNIALGGTLAAAGSSVTFTWSVANSKFYSSRVA